MATRTLPRLDRFRCDAVELAKDEKGDGKSLKILAYTGAPVRRWYGPLCIDLAGMEIPRKLPVLMDHDMGKRVGFSDGGIAKSDTALTVEGRLLTNEHGNAFAAECAQGFPFQASVGVEFTRIEELKAGDEKKVNGRIVRGPCDIATKSRLIEVSVLACGADSNTRAESFARDGQETIEVMSEPTPTPTPAPKPDYAAIKAAVGNRADLALQAIEQGLTPDQAKGLLADALGAENAELRKKLAEKPATTQVQVVPFGAARETVAEKLKPEPSGMEILAPDAIEDLAAEDVVELAAKAMKSDKALRKEFSGKADDLAAYVRMEAEGRVKILAPAEGRHDSLGAFREEAA